MQRPFVTGGLTETLTLVPRLWRASLIPQAGEGWQDVFEVPSGLST